MYSLMSGRSGSKLYGAWVPSKNWKQKKGLPSAARASRNPRILSTALTSRTQEGSLLSISFMSPDGIDAKIVWSNSGYVKRADVWTLKMYPSSLSQSKSSGPRLALRKLFQLLP